MSEVMDRAEEKLLASIGKSQEASAAKTPAKTAAKTTTRKKATTASKPATKSAAKAQDSVTAPAGTTLGHRNRFIGRLRWPD